MKFNPFNSSGYFSIFLKYLKAETSSSQFHSRNNVQYCLLVNNPLIWYKELNLQIKALKFYLENISFFFK